MAHRVNRIVDIPALRLAGHGISAPRRERVSQLVARLGAVQAQEYPFAKWGIGLRLQGVVEADVERAFTSGEILRTHVMRPTWHFVTAEDIGWMLKLTAPRVHVTMRSYLLRQGLDVRLIRRALATFEAALEGGQCLTRAELGERLRRKRIDLTAMQMGFVTIYAELERIICSGPRRGRSFTYALLAERAPHARQLSGDEALGTLAGRFFSSHGPATVKDFVWWSGLRTVDARRGIDIARLHKVEQDGLSYWTPEPHPEGSHRRGVHLLPIYDEYLVAYRDRVAVPHGRAENPRLAVTFRHTVVIDGQIAGTWTLARTPEPATLRITPLRRLTRREREHAAEAAQRYATFLQGELQVTFDAPPGPV